MSSCGLCFSACKRVCVCKLCDSMIAQAGKREREAPSFLISFLSLFIALFNNQLISPSPHELKKNEGLRETPAFPLHTAHVFGC
jgi:hypothetical protein